MFETSTSLRGTQRKIILKSTPDQTHMWGNTYSRITKIHALQFFFTNAIHMHHTCTLHISQDVVAQSPFCKHSTHLYLKGNEEESKKWDTSVLGYKPSVWQIYCAANTNFSRESSHLIITITSTLSITECLWSPKCLQMWSSRDNTDLFADGWHVEAC